MGTAIAASSTGWVHVADTYGLTYDLGVDTASDDASLALFARDDATALAVHTFHAEGSMTRSLLGELAAFLDRAGVARDAIGRIAVTTGPGQYGALRAGIASMQGMALALGLPLAGVSRLQADATALGAGAPGPSGGLPIVAVHLTRTGPAWAAYEDVDGIARELSAPRIGTFDEAAAAAPRPAIWTGELDDRLHAARDAAGRTSDTVSQGSGTPRAVAIVQIARALNLFGDPALVDAVYLRPPPITPPREH